MPPPQRVLEAFHVLGVVYGWGLKLDIKVNKFSEPYMCCFECKFKLWHCPEFYRHLHFCTGPRLNLFFTEAFLEIVWYVYNGYRYASGKGTSRFYQYVPLQQERVSNKCFAYFIFVSCNRKTSIGKLIVFLHFTKYTALSHSHNS